MSAYFRKFGVRVTMAIVVSMVIVVVLNGILIYQITFRSQFQDVRTHLMAIAQTAAISINTEDLAKIPLSKEGKETQPYSIISAHLNKIKAANPQIKYIYILTKTDESHMWKFIIDESGKGQHDVGSEPGSNYDAGRFKDMLRGFNEPAADHRIEMDEWGKTLSGYAPLRDSMGRPFAVLGVDIDAQDISLMHTEVVWKTCIVLLVGIVVAILLGFLISRRVTQPVARLIAGSRYIGEGNLHYEVQIKGDDEIAQLAQAFNLMSRNLMVSRKQLVGYFFDTVKSMVKILEVRDQYTLGHSEAVAKHADRIAERMGIDSKTREMFHNVCLLHDIGKVGVRDSILLKPDRLTDEEWKIIQMHPVWGDQILKLILQDPVMTKVIRNHHERYDGKGYPDGLKGDEIPLLVSIATVADSYDAMTSTRSYRKAMTKEEALAQLVKNRGTQFNPKVVDVFLEIEK